MLHQFKKSLIRLSQYQSRGYVLDCLFLTIVVVISVAFYVTKLGFYSDDWAFWGTFSFLNHQSYIEFLKTIFFSHNQPSPLQSSLMRPVQILYLTGLYFIFSLHPLGYHLVNAFVLLLSCLLFYVTLQYLKLPRIISVALPLLYILMPNYSTDRFWIAAFQANLSMAAYFLSLYSGLKGMHSSTKNLWWKLLSIVSLLISTLSYEVVLPLFLFNTFLFHNPDFWQTMKTSAKSKKQSISFILLYIITLGIVVLYKFITTTRLGNGPFQHLIHYPGYVVYTIHTALSVNFLDLGVKLPYILWKIFFIFPNAVILTIGILLGIFIFWYLYSFTTRTKIDIPNSRYMLKLTLVGLLIFVLGYAIFFVNNNINFTPTGIGNRVAIAAAAGMAITLIGIVGWISNLLFSGKVVTLFFSLCIAILCTVYFIITTTLSLFWINAYHQEQKILYSIHRKIPTLASNSTVILDGVCPYNGPAIIFESNWDLRGVLILIYHNSTLHADVVTPNLKIENNDLHTRIYNQNAYYPYKNLLIYNYKNNMVYPLPNEKSASGYFQKYDRDFSNSCPKGSAGLGVAVF